ncbi:MAG: Hsp20/alpha crystallin family protein [Candidatus Dormibacteria bacterium]
MALVRWNPWTDLFSLHDQMDQLFSQAYGGEAPGRSGSGAADQSWMTLPVDIRQTERAFTIQASVPGFRPEDVEVTVEEGVLSIRGRLSQSEETRESGWVRRERRMGSFHRQIGMPAEVRADEVSAEFENGVLTITVPRAQKAQPKRIPVTASKGRTEGKVIDAGQSNSKESGSKKS